MTLPDIGVRLKWPNDIYAVQEPTEDLETGSSEKSNIVKIGGVLCQSSYDGRGDFHVTVGFGLNVTNSEPTTCIFDLYRRRLASSQEQLPPISVRIFIRPNHTYWKVFLATFFNKFEAMHEQLVREGFTPFEAEYLR